MVPSILDSLTEVISKDNQKIYQLIKKIRSILFALVDIIARKNTCNNFCAGKLFEDNFDKHSNWDGHNHTRNSPNKTPEHKHYQHCDDIYRERFPHKHRLQN